LRQSVSCFLRSNKPAERWGAAVIAGWLIFIVLAIVLSGAGCSRYNPALYVSYDVLNAGEAVRKNPLQVIEDPVTHEPLFVVNGAFLMWVDELKQEIVKLRKGK
jgi:hypothetical protein